MNRVRLYRRAQQLLPAVVETAGLQRFSLHPGQWRCLMPGLPARGESSGAVVLALSDPAARAIEREGLDYFSGATLSRGALPPRGPAYYQPWRRSPFGDAGSGPWPWSGHVEMDSDMRRRLGHAGNEGAYYTRGITDGGWLVVLPKERLVVYSWWD